MNRTKIGVVDAMWIWLDKMKLIGVNIVVSVEPAIAPNG